MELTPREWQDEPNENEITQGMREEAKRLSVSLAEQAVRTSQQTVRKLSELEMAIERQQELYKEEKDHVVHEALSAIRSALNEILEDEEDLK